MSDEMGGKNGQWYVKVYKRRERIERSNGIRLSLRVVSSIIDGREEEEENSVNSAAAYVSIVLLRSIIQCSFCF